MLINVTQEHIEKGKPREPSDCPVVHALKEAIGDEWEVDGICASHYELGLEVEIILPPEVTNRITKYDATGKMDPFSFEFEP